MVADPGDPWPFTEGLNLRSASVRAEGWKNRFLNAWAPGLCKWLKPPCQPFWSEVRQGVCVWSQAVCVCVCEVRQGVCVCVWLIRNKLLSAMVWYCVCSSQCTVTIGSGGWVSEKSVNLKCSIKVTSRVEKPKPYAGSCLNCNVHMYYITVI